MRNMTACAVYDCKADAWHNPMFFQSKGQAHRSFSDAVNQKDSDFNRHPEDYAMYVVGYFNGEDGAMMGHGPEIICTGIDVREVIL